MKLISLMLIAVIFSACVQSENTDETEILDDFDTTVILSSNYQLKDTTVQFLWREMSYDSILKDTLSSIFINHSYIDLMSDAEKAAVGYVSTFIGSECWWDGDDNEDRSNLDCKIITALGLGFQCSDEHLGFLRKWFSTDEEILTELEKSNCPTTPYTATNQNTFDEIELSVRHDSVIVFFKASGINMREKKSWSWSETNYFKLNGQDLILLEKVESETIHESF